MSHGASVSRRLLVIPPVLIAIAVLVWLARGKPTPQADAAGENPRSARVIEVLPLELVPVARGFGSVQPARVWAAVAEVPGRVVEMHPELHNGVILPAGTGLLRIDPVDYELAIARARAQLAELAVQEDNTGASLAIERRSLAIAERELERVSGLVAKGSLPQSEADAAERAVLGSRTAVQNLRNTLALIPVQRRSLEAQLAQSERELQRTELRAPFDLRVAALAVEQHQFVSTGQKLFEGDAVDRVEVVAQFALPQIRNLLLPGPEMEFDAATLNRRLAELTGFRPLLRLDLGAARAEWEAEFVRMSDTIDPQTRTLGVVVAVDRPFELAVPGIRPPLTKGMFLEVLLRGRVQPDRLLVPRSAVRDAALYVADAEDRLRRREVEVAFEQGDYVVLAGGLSAGDRVVVSDLVPAVEGMLLRPVLDAETAEALRQAAGAGR